MDKILNRICSINNHPISCLDEAFRIKYVKGLGACLFVLSNNSPITKMMFIVWAKSILQSSKDSSVFWKEDHNTIKNAISVQRKKFHFFSMRNHFFFDILYLLESSLQNKYNQSEAVAYLQKNVCGVFSKKSLKKTLLTLAGSGKSNGDAALFSHRKRNIQYTKIEEKKVLVVANVSAGKSTLINALVGNRLNRTRTTACTNKLVYIHNKQESDGITIKKENGAYEYYEGNCIINSERFSHAAFHFNSTLSQSAVCIIDTPGINNALDSSHKQITEDAIKSNDYDVVVYVSNCRYSGINDEHSILSFIKKNVKKTVIFVLNQLDCFKTTEDSIIKMLNDYKTDLKNVGFDNPVVVPVSARAAILSKLDDGCLDEDDLYDKETLKKRFEKDYYDLPSYITSKSNVDFMDRTGITLLENSLLTLIKPHVK